jgi:hypothetical protein
MHPPPPYHPISPPEYPLRPHTLIHQWMDIHCVLCTCTSSWCVPCTRTEKRVVSHPRRAGLWAKDRRRPRPAQYVTGWRLNNTNITQLGDAPSIQFLIHWWQLLAGGGACGVPRQQREREGASETDDTDFGDDSGGARGGRWRGLSHPQLLQRYGP